MSRIDETKTFIPVSIAVLTVSDTRSLDEDKSGRTLADRIESAGHKLADRQIVTDDIPAIQAQVKKWIEDKNIDVVITTGGTGFTGRDVTPDALEPLFVGTSTIQSRATAGVAGATFIFCLPGSPGACKDGWDGILIKQLDYRHMPCNFVEIMPRLD